MSSGDTAWVLVSTALVFFMIPGLALFYGGMTRRKNVLSTLMQCIIVVCLMSVQWVLLGYTLAFGPDSGFGILGNLDFICLRNVGFNAFNEYSKTIPHLAFMIFQCMFAIITPALVIGALAERIKFSSFCIFSLLWATFVYDPIAHWIWGAGGWLKELGGLDFAGGMVVHGSSGFAALVVCILIGRRVGYQEQPFRPHNLPFTVLGAGMLWFGWFGFNGGSALEASGLAVNAFVNTNIAAAVAALTWAIWEWQKHGAPTMLGLVTGIIAGLGAITPACGYVRPLAAIPIGILAGIFSFLAVTKLKAKLGYDDSLDVFGVHGICGVWGTIATGLFAEKAINAAGANGFLFGNVKLLLIQGLYVAVTICYSVAVTWVLYKFVEAFMGMRVEKKDEIIGLDLTQHHESAYTVVE